MEIEDKVTISNIEKLLKVRPKIRGSYYFEDDLLYRPNFIIGCYIEKRRLLFNPKGNWFKVEYTLTGYPEYEKFFEGEVNSMKDLQVILKCIGYKIKDNE